MAIAWFYTLLIVLRYGQHKQHVQELVNAY